MLFFNLSTLKNGRAYLYAFLRCLRERSTLWRCVLRCVDGNRALTCTVQCLLLQLLCCWERSRKRKLTSYPQFTTVVDLPFTQWLLITNLITHGWADRQVWLCITVCPMARPLCLSSVTDVLWLNGRSYRKSFFTNN